MTPEEILIVAACEAQPFTRAKIEALAAVQPLPVELGDFIKWETSIRVSGWAIGEEALKVGKGKLPHWIIWNPKLEEYQFVPKSEAVLLGYGKV